MSNSIVIIVLALLLVGAFRLHRSAVRLDRLHLRTHAAWAALEGAFARRIVVARTIAALEWGGPGYADHLHQAAADADDAPAANRAAAEDELSRTLAKVPADLPDGLLAELADARLRVNLALAFYNDAVRDTTALRSAVFVRFFRLAGWARAPQPFTLTEQV